MNEEFLKFKDIEYVRPNKKELLKVGKESINKMKNSENYEEFKEAYKVMEEKMIDFYSMSTICYIRNTIDMNDKFYDKENKYISMLSGSYSSLLLKLTDVILESKYKSELEKEYGSFLLKDLEMSKKTMSKKIIFLLIKTSLLGQKYSKKVALCKTNFRGEECNFYGLLKHMQDVDRDVRREAFHAWADLYESVSKDLDKIYDKLVIDRVKIAKKLKFDSFIDYSYISRGRYDYSKEDVKIFRKEVKEYIVPLANKLYEEQAKRLEIDKLHWYDEDLTFKDGNALPQGSKDELVSKAKEMYSDLSSEAKEFFEFMTNHDLFDLDTRPGKHLGGYCTFIPKFKAPFIFSNFNGTSQDVDVLTHEAGHAFQGYIGSRHINNILLMNSTSEINEIHSMSMEHFTYPYMDKFFGENSDKYLYHHLTNAIKVIPYLVSVDLFQHKVFENPKMTALERRKIWRDIEKEYMPWRDYEDNEFLNNGGFWMQKQHIFLHPFYYIDYALAQTCAFQFLIKYRNDFDSAWNDYLNLCKAGGTKGYFDLLEVANLKNPFKEGTVKEVVSEVEKIINEFGEKINN
ncbi:MAG: M3 family oligoendopeptidase [Bacilli bacterium]|nr:M3 family oligoendopeptidase [Bacilli bacterium]